MNSCALACLVRKRQIMVKNIFMGAVCALFTSARRVLGKKSFAIHSQKIFLFELRIIAAVREKCCEEPKRQQLACGRYSFYSIRSLCGCAHAHVCAE